jgi:hypothetical protein
MGTRSGRIRRYQVVSTSIWDDDKIKAMDDDCKILFLYLLTCKHTNLPGLFVMPKLYISHDLKWPLPRVAKGLLNLCESKIIQYNDITETILMCNHLKHRPLDNPNKVTGAIQALEEVPKSHLFITLLSIITELKTPEYSTLLQYLNKSCETIAQPLTNQIQIQIQKQIQIQNGCNSEKSGVDSPIENPIALQLCELLNELILEVDDKFKPKSWKRWNQEMDRLIRIDKRDPFEIEEIIRFAKSDDFWKGVIIAPEGLRKHYTKLLAQMKNGGNSKISRHDKNMAALEKSLKETNGGESYGFGKNGEKLIADVGGSAAGQNNRGSVYQDLPGNAGRHPGRNTGESSETMPDELQILSYDCGIEGEGSPVAAGVQLEKLESDSDEIAF